MSSRVHWIQMKMEVMQWIVIIALWPSVVFCSIIEQDRTCPFAENAIKLSNQVCIPDTYEYGTVITCSI
jgi:hypothetical protein